MQELPIRIALVGDYDPEVTAHRAIPLAIEMAAKDLGLEAEATWVPTESLTRPIAFEPDGIWCVPASPYRSTTGALTAIRYARENGVPFLGTCGGFQHAVLEFAQNVLGWTDAAHAEMDSEAARPVIIPLACALVDQTGEIRLLRNTHIAEAYGQELISEEYRCRYGMSPDVQDALVKNGMRITAVDDAGDVRAIELVGHPFFVATLFQHERAALKGNPTPLVRAFLQHAYG